MKTESSKLRPRGLRVLLGTAGAAAAALTAAVTLPVTAESEDRHSASLPSGSRPMPAPAAATPPRVSLVESTRTDAGVEDAADAAAMPDAGLGDETDSSVSDAEPLRFPGSPEAMSLELVSRGYAAGDGAHASYREYIDLLSTDREAAVDLMRSALEALPAGGLFRPEGRALIVTLGEMATPAAIEALDDIARRPWPADPRWRGEAVVTRTMTLEALANAAQAGSPDVASAVRERLEAQLSDDGAEASVLSVAGSLLVAASPTPDQERLRVAALLGVKRPD